MPGKEVPHTCSSLVRWYQVPGRKLKRTGGHEVKERVGDGPPVGEREGVLCLPCYCPVAITAVLASAESMMRGIFQGPGSPASLATSPTSWNALSTRSPSPGTGATQGPAAGVLQSQEGGRSEPGALPICL